MYDASFDNFSFYPNPAKNDVTFNSKNPIQKIEFYNFTGQKVQNANPESVNSSVDVSHLQPGVYIMKVTIDKTEKVFRLIKK